MTKPRPVSYVGENDTTLVVRMPMTMKVWLKTIADGTPDCSVSDLVRGIIRERIAYVEGITTPQEKEIYG